MPRSDPKYYSLDPEYINLLMQNEEKINNQININTDENGNLTDKEYCGLKLHEWENLIQKLRENYNETFDEEEIEKYENAINELAKP